MSEIVKWRNILFVALVLIAITMMDRRGGETQNLTPNDLLLTSMALGAGQ